MYLSLILHFIFHNFSPALASYSAFDGASGILAFWVLRLVRDHHDFYKLIKQGVKTNTA